MAGTKGRQGDVHEVDAVAPSAADRERIDWRRRRVTRAQRLARVQLRDASSELVESRPKDARWYCLEVKRGFDFTVEAALKDAGVTVLAPREAWTKVVKGQKVEAHRAFFPGYLLVRIVPSAEAFAGLRNQKNVAGFVGGESGYHVIVDADVAVFQAVSAPDPSSMPVDKTIGQASKCRITAGPLAGFECVVLDVKWKREARGRVQINVAGNFVVVDRLPIAFLEKL